MENKFSLVRSVFEHSEREKRNKDRISMIRKYQELYKTETGKQVFEDILALCHYGELALGKSNDETNFNLGIQNVGVEIASILNADLTKLEETKDEYAEED